MIADLCAVADYMKDHDDDEDEVGGQTQNQKFSFFRINHFLFRSDWNKQCNH